MPFHRRERMWRWLGEIAFSMYAYCHRKQMSSYWARGGGDLPGSDTRFGKGPLPPVAIGTQATIDGTQMVYDGMGWRPLQA